jgi:glycerol kinase
LIIDHSGKLTGIAQKEFKQYFPQPGWVEHDPEEIWSSQAAVMSEAIARAGISPNEILGIGITNQRETTIVWERNSGKAICPAIVWQDRRTSEFCTTLMNEGRSELVRSKTGLIIDAYFSATKIRWILEHIEGAREKAEKGDLCFGTVDSWLIWKLSRGARHVTDATNASRTMLYNIHTGQWDEELLDLLGVPRSMLPEVLDSSGLFAETSGDVTGYNIPITGVAGDQQAALFGQLCLETGMAKNTYGTGCFMVMNTGDTPVVSENNLLTTVAWQLGGKLTYALEGSIFVAGAVVQWLRDELGLITNASQSEELARTVDDTAGVVLVPALTGLGAPHWDQYARGTIIGLTRGAGKAHIVRAALESIAYQVSDVSRAMAEDAGQELTELRVDGGATANNFLMQFQADILDTLVTRPKLMETTALGAAYLAGLATGFWDSTDALQEQWQVDRQYRPGMENQRRTELLATWKKAVERSKNWVVT